jgi:isopentenyl-diphosphate Delta-isomerase
MIYTTDETGKLLELESRETLHLTKFSKRHAAVIGMIQRSDGRLLLQWRGAKKLGGSRLDVSATTHVRKNETFETALQRSFDNELRIPKVPLKHAFDFTYVEELGDHKENEYCKVYVGNFDGVYKPNPEEIDSVEWMSLKELREFVKIKKDKATKWLRETVVRLEPSMLTVGSR